MLFSTSSKPSKPKLNKTETGYFEIFRDGSRDWRFHLKGGNHKIMVTAEGFYSKAHAKRAITRLKDIVNNSQIRERN